jgi:hypothetical protein
MQAAHIFDCLCHKESPPPHVFERAYTQATVAEPTESHTATCVQLDEPGDN